MNQIPNIEEEVESPLYELKNRIKWDYSYYISREGSADGYWKRVDSIDQVPLHAAPTHRTHPVEEPENLFLYKIYQYLLTHHQELQKARDDAWQEAVDLADKIELQEPDGGTKQWMAFKAFRNTLRDKIKDHSELTQDPVYDFFTAPEEVQRPVVEEAIKKASEEQTKLTNNQTL